LVDFVNYWAEAAQRTQNSGRSEQHNSGTA